MNGADTVVPRDETPFDSTIAMMREGYRFIWDRCSSLNTNIFRTRIMGKRTVCLHGPEAAKLFYEVSKMERHNAVPRRISTSLFGKKAVHTLDGDAHRVRKDAFLKLMTPDYLEDLTETTAREWRTAIRTRWLKDDKPIVLFDEVAFILTKATAEWVGIRMTDPEEVAARSRDFIAMVDAFGGVGPRAWRGKLARMRSEHWMKRHILRARQHQQHQHKHHHQEQEEDALHVMANLRDRDGELLDAHTAAVEVLNLIRPTVAIAWYVAFAALALHSYPECKKTLSKSRPSSDANIAYRDLFVQEVRRFYPFTPYLRAKTRTGFEWRGHRFDKGTMVFLDVYGANHDPKLWSSPHIFRPERFSTVTPTAYDFIPQGGGPRTGHRCPGEWITMHNIALALHFLTHCITYDVEARQDMTFDLTRMPTRPKSGVVIKNVQLIVPAIDAAPPRAPSHIALRDSEVSLST